MSRKCSVLIDDKREIGDIEISPSSHASSNTIPDGARLRLLSIVETTLIPLRLIVSPPLLVIISNTDTKDWFQDVLPQHPLGKNEDCAIPWWETAKRDSSLGILVAVPETKDLLPASNPRVTELLFYASQSNHVEPGHAGTLSASVAEHAHRANLSIYAVALSSDLLRQPDSEPTPPPSPILQDAEIAGTFLPPLFPAIEPIINEPPIRKRKSAIDAFDEASERRKKTRRKGGEGVSATAATKADSQPEVLQSRRSNSLSQPAQFQTRPFSRSPSVSSSRPPTAAPSGTRVSTLSRVQSASAITDASNVEMKNKNLISRIVMAGMRLYGLSQSKTRKSRASSAAPSPALDARFEELDAERKKDEEFKLIYHQAFKGACFAFRAVIAERNMQASSDAVRDVADKLLALFCCDPLDDCTRSSLAQPAASLKETFASSVS